MKTQTLTLIIQKYNMFAEQCITDLKQTISLQFICCHSL